MVDRISSTSSEQPTAPPAQPPAPPAAKPPKKGHPWVVVLIVAVLAGVVFLLYHQYKAAQQAKEEASAKSKAADRGVPVSTAAAKKGNVGIYVEALGTVTPVYTVTVTSRVQGQIMDVYYKEGQTVHKGDPLIEIDPRPYQAALVQAQGQLAHDTAVLSEARIDLGRYQQALSQNAIAQQQVYDQEEAVKQDEGTVQIDQGALDTAKVNLAYCHITSPIDGRVGLRLVDPGNIVQANSTTSLVVITQLQPITVIFSVAEDDLSQIEQQLRGGEKLKVYALDRDQQTTLATGTLLTLDNQVDTTTGTVKLRAVFPNANNALFPDQFVNAKLLVRTEQNVVLVPTAAIQRNSQAAFVYLVEANDVAKVVNVTPGASDGNFTAVQGVQPGQVVVTSGFEKLQDGIKVQPRKGTKNQPSSNSNGDEAP